MGRARISKDLKFNRGVSYGIRKGNKGTSRKLLQIKDAVGLNNETETMRYCIQKVWKDMFEDNQDD